MKYALITLLLVAATSLVGCGSAALRHSDADQPHGAVSVATTVPPSDLYRVVLQDVDGRPPAGAGARRVPPHVSLMVVSQFFDISDARSEFNLPPGEHTLSLTAIIDRKDARMFVPTPSHQADKGAGELKLTVQEGKRYFVAAKVNDIQPDRWEVVVYKVEDIPNYGKPKG